MRSFIESFWVESLFWDSLMTLLSCESCQFMSENGAAGDASLFQLAPPADLRAWFRATREIRVGKLLVEAAAS